MSRMASLAKGKQKVPSGLLWNSNTMPGRRLAIFSRRFRLVSWACSKALPRRIMRSSKKANSTDKPRKPSTTARALRRGAQDRAPVWPHLKPRQQTPEMLDADDAVDQSAKPACRILDGAGKN